METTTRKYPRQTQVRFSDEQFDRVKHNAASAGLSLAAFVRKKAVGEIVRAKTDERMILELRRQGGLFKTAWQDGQPTGPILDEIETAISRIAR